MSAYSQAAQRARDVVKAKSVAIIEKKLDSRSPVADQMFAGGSLMFGGQQTRIQTSYSQYRGWPYAVIHAVARRVAAQPWGIAKRSGSPASKRPKCTKRLAESLRRWGCVKGVADVSEMEVLSEHPVLDLLNRPNQLQRKFDFLYMSAVNMLLCGECYWILGAEDELWCVPTHWIRPKHEGGMFTSYELVLSEASKIELPAEAVARSYTPHPADLRMAMSPLQAVASSVQIDDAIVESQRQMFERGIFPNLVVTVGRMPGPDGKLTDRRWALTGAQRAQIIRAIRQIWSQSVGAGDPAIIDGLIESIHKLQSTPQEMDWMNSSEIVRRRIMTAFGVNEIVLGMTENANRAAAVVAEQSVCANSVNPLVAAFSETADEFLGSKHGVVVWLEPSEPIDPDLELQRWATARQLGDVTRSEFRAEVLGLPPLDDDESKADSKTESPGGVQAAVAVLNAAAMGAMESEAASGLLQRFLGVPKREADLLAGVGKSKPEASPEPPPAPSQPTGPTQDEESQVEPAQPAAEVEIKPATTPDGEPAIEIGKGVGLTRERVKAARSAAIKRAQACVAKAAAEHLDECVRSVVQSIKGDADPLAAVDAVFLGEDFERELKEAVEPGLTWAALSGAVAELALMETVFGVGEASPRPTAQKRPRGGVVSTTVRDAWLKYDPDQPRDDHGRWVSAGGETLHSARRGDDGKWRLADGSEVPEHIAKIAIPPAWTDVYVNLDPDGDMLVRGIDTKGFSHRIYSENHNMKAAADKFGRVTELLAQQKKVVAEVKKDMQDPKLRERAACLLTIIATGIRPGSEKDTRAAKKAYGATTLEGRHVVVGDDGRVRLQFVGKKGVSLDIAVEDEHVAKMLVERAKRAGSDGKLFAVKASQVLEYSKTKDGGGFKTKDHRTALGTSIAMRIAKGMPKPSTMKEYKAQVKAVAERVSSALGNTPSVALKAYIDPHVFVHWRTAIKK